MGLQMEQVKQVSIKAARYWEVDVFRGLAIILMVFYHLIWDLNYFGVVELNMIRGPWNWFARGIATMFLTTMGLSLVLSYNRAKDKGDAGTLFLKFFWRGARIFGLGMLITAATYLFLDFRGGRGFVIFGILHIIGFSIMAAYPFLPYRRRWFSLALGLLIVAVGFYIGRLVSPSPWLIWLGVKQASRLMVDYFPVLPWFGVALLGIVLGHTLYSGGIRRFSLSDDFYLPPVRGLAFLGRHALLIYLIHQPILLGTLLLLGIGAL
jgi:uncharacterized membrane protein